MNTTIVLDIVNLFCAGLLAGTLLAVEYGVGRAIVMIVDERSQIQARQALIKTLRILVPALFIPTIIVGVATAVSNGGEAGFVFRYAGALLVVTCFVLTLVGTAPINKTIGGWQASDPPKNWQMLISRWQGLDMARTWIGIAAFAFYLIAEALKLATH